MSKSIQVLAISLLSAAVCVTPAQAGSHQHDQIEYQQAVLKRFAIRQAGLSCSGSGTMQGHASDSGEVTGQTTSTSNCIPRETAYYTIAAGDHIFVLRPEFNGKQIRLNAVTLGYANFFRKNSVLYHQLPGTSIWVRTEGNAMFVKVGKRESRYEVVEAR